MQAAGGLRFLAALCVLAAGCAGPGNVSRGVFDAAALAAVDFWELRGRVALDSDGRGLQANVRWRQQDGQAQLTLSGPWGAGTRRLRIDGQDVALRSGGEWVRLCDPGVAVGELELLCSGAPAQNLRFWLRGLPAPGSPFLESYPGRGAAREFQQTGWRVTVNALSESGGLMVPGKLRISGPGATMKVAITDWQLSPSP